MEIKKIYSRILIIVLSLVFFIVSVYVLFPLSFLNKIKAANFTVQTGTYVGTGVAGNTISNIGFQPDFVLIRATTTAGAAVFKTSAMPANTIAFTSATANNTATNITFTSTGFSVGTLANVNSANVIYIWVAIAGSDCTVTGNFCVGTYTGNGAATRDIATGFQPSTAIIKRTTNVAGNFRVASQPVNESLYLNSTARDTAGNLIRSFAATSFQVGATNNVNAGVYYFVAFSTTANAFTQGTYTGNGADNRNITGIGFQPDFVLVKNAIGSVAADRQPVINTINTYGDSSVHVGDTTASLVNAVQALQSDGFQVGTNTKVNRNTDPYYYFAIRGVSPYSTFGSFTSASGSYVGTGALASITGLGFTPDLVIIKADTAQFAVFRTKTMAADSTAYFASATANFTGGITSLAADGFNLGTSVIVNAAGITYRWQAFGGAYDPYDNTGATDFAVGAYYGNGIDSTDIKAIPWSPDLVVTKRSGASSGIWRTSSQVGDAAMFFLGNAETSDMIQAFNSDGFQVGASFNTNTVNNVYHWFAFKEGANFAVGTYAGTGNATAITTAGFRAENVWIKRTTAIAPVMSSVANASGESQYFTNTANVVDRIVGFSKNGFLLGGNQLETNSSVGNYYYAAWNNSAYSIFGAEIVDAINVPIANPTLSLSPLATSFNCQSSNTILGVANQKIRINNISSNPAWNLSIAPTNGPTALWQSTTIGTDTFDFNDPTSLGCQDGGDLDTKGGQLQLEATNGVLQSDDPSCVLTNISFSGLSSFVQGVSDSVQLVNAGSGAEIDCVWDLTNIDVFQSIPPEVQSDDYFINLTLTLTAI